MHYLFQKSDIELSDKEGNVSVNIKKCNILSSLNELRNIASSDKEENKRKVVLVNNATFRKGPIYFPFTVSNLIKAREVYQNIQIIIRFEWGPSDIPFRTEEDCRQIIYEVDSLEKFVSFIPFIRQLFDLNYFIEYNFIGIENMMYIKDIEIRYHNSYIHIEEEKDVNHFLKVLGFTKPMKNWYRELNLNDKNGKSKFHFISLDSDADTLSKKEYKKFSNIEYLTLTIVEQYPKEDDNSLIELDTEEFENTLSDLSDILTTCLYLPQAIGFLIQINTEVIIKEIKVEVDGKNGRRYTTSITRSYLEEFSLFNILNRLLDY